jgi:hypothetical protein
MVKMQVPYDGEYLVYNRLAINKTKMLTLVDNKDVDTIKSYIALFVRNMHGLGLASGEAGYREWKAVMAGNMSGIVPGRYYRIDASIIPTLVDGVWENMIYVNHLGEVGGSFKI